MPDGRLLDDIQHGEFGFSRKHNWTAYEGRWGCEHCRRIVDDWSLIPDDCDPHDEPALQASANVGYSVSKRRK